MTLHKAIKVVVITEIIISEQVCHTIESCGATGYTVVAAGGKGDRNVRTISDRASVVEEFRNIKIECIVKTHDTAQLILESVAEKWFRNYSGIAYLEEVEILRSDKF